MLLCGCQTYLEDPFKLWHPGPSVSDSLSRGRLGSGSSNSFASAAAASNRLEFQCQVLSAMGS